MLISAVRVMRIIWAVITSVSVSTGSAMRSSLAESGVPASTIARE